MRNEKKGRYAGRFILVYILTIVYTVIIMALGSCRTTKVAEQAETAYEQTIVDAGADTVAVNGDFSVSETCRDAQSGSRRDGGSVVIRRDQQGLPVFIWWQAQTSFEGVATHEGEARGAIASEAISGRLNVSTASGSATERKEKEVQEPLRASQVIECYIGTTLMVLALLYIGFVILKDGGGWQWIKKALKWILRL